MLKKIKYFILFSVGVPVISLMLKGLAKTVKLSFNDQKLKEQIQTPEAAIGAIWHGDLLGLAIMVLKTKLYRKKKLFILASQSRDGEIVARIVRSFGVTAVRGSSSRGGAKGLLELKEKLLEKGSIALAVDGPKGPRHVAKSGVIMLARSAGVPVYPLAYQFSRKTMARSWDQTEIPRPFSRIKVNIGQPILVPPTISPTELETLRQQLENTLLMLKGRPT